MPSFREKMETKASKTSLEGWKPLEDREGKWRDPCLKNFLRGMETRGILPKALLQECLKNFLRGMETSKVYLIRVAARAPQKLP